MARDSTLVRTVPDYFLLPDQEAKNKDTECLNNIFNEVSLKY